MRDQQPTLFDGARLSLGDSIDLTVESLRAYGPRYRHWALAYSGGKDSSATVSLVGYLLRTGRIDPPERLTVCYADTRMELPPLSAAAVAMLAALRAEGVDCRVVLPPLDERYFVYMFGRGVPPPTNTFRWCTGQIKVEPMAAELATLAAAAGGKVLMLTGVRVGESAARDQRIALSCSKDGAECGQGWFQETLPEHLCDTLAPLLHWRTCLVWDWLADQWSVTDRHGYPTQAVADAYGLELDGSPSEIGARTGCIGCNLAARDTALDNLLRSQRWEWLTPLKRLKELYRELRQAKHRLRKPGFETGANGVIRYTNRLGPLTLAARRWGMEMVREVQYQCNAHRPADALPIDVLNDEEVARINELIASNTWPNRWTGTEPTGDTPFDRVSASGELQREWFGS